MPPDLELNLERIAARQSIGAGIGIALVCPALGLYSLAATGRVTIAVQPAPFILFGGMACGTFVGMAVGALTGLGRRQCVAFRAREDGSNPAPWARRTALSLLPAAMLIVNVPPTFVLAARILVATPQMGQYPPDARLPGGLLQAGAALMLARFAVAEWLYRRVRRMPPLRCTEDAESALRVDAAWRSELVRYIYHIAGLIAGLAMSGIGLGQGFNVFTARELPSQVDLIGFFALFLLNLVVGSVVWSVALTQGR